MKNRRLKTGDSLKEINDNVLERSHTLTVENQDGFIMYEIDFFFQ